MPNYRRAKTPGGCYFFTVNLSERHQSHLTDNIDLLHQSVRKVKQTKPFIINAWVVLPNHLHCIWTLPHNDHDFSSRWREIKKSFSKLLPKTEFRSKTQIQRKERGIWQRRFWEHQIRDEEDYAAHMNYIHYNPIKHGLVEALSDWPYSSFHHHVKAGIYSSDWASNMELDILAGEPI